MQKNMTQWPPVATGTRLYVHVKAREAESRYRGYRRYREANDPKGKKYQKRQQKMILCFPKDTNCGRNNSQGERVVACVCEIIIKGLPGKSSRIFFQFSKIFQGSLKMLFLSRISHLGSKWEILLILIRLQSGRNVHVFWRPDLWYHICFPQNGSKIVVL